MFNFRNLRDFSLAQNVDMTCSEANKYLTRRWTYQSVI
ncbi:hypothetical protein Z945_1660 [Sulfitobacter noctilucae]|nr:hypothetical protein Z945_1660 [Sulfitobacter noctilucae]